MALHGDLEQRDRDQTLVRFANGSARILVATDVAARGLDIKSLELVVNYELARDPEVHVHRIGRTARAGSSGTAISFCAPEEAQRANILSEMLQLKLNWLNAPARQSLLLWPQRWLPYALTAAKSENASGRYFGRADRRYWIRRDGYRQN